MTRSYGLWLSLLCILHFAPRPLFSSDSDCGVCHRRQWREWRESAHAAASSSRAYLRALNRVKDAHRDDPRKIGDCASCHSPRRLLDARRHAGSGRSDGVGCTDCHGLPHGGVAGPRRLDGRAAVVSSGRLVSPALCGRCHRGARGEDDACPRMPVFESWHRSWARFQSGCRECHMTADDGGTSHAFPGGGDERMWREALAVSLDRRGRSLSIEVRNVGAGHLVPADARMLLEIETSLLDEDGYPVMTYRDYIGPRSCQCEYLDYDEGKLFVHLIPSSAVEALCRVRLGRGGRVVLEERLELGGRTP